MEEAKTPIFNIDLIAFDTFLLAIRTTDGKILMKLDSDGNFHTTGEMFITDTLGYYNKEKNEINNGGIPKSTKE